MRVRDKTGIVLGGFWVASVIAIFLSGFLESPLFHSLIITAFFASSVAGVSYVRIIESDGDPARWLLKGIAACAVLAAIAFLYQGHHSSDDEGGGYPLYEEEYKPPTFESRSVVAVTVFGRCFLGVCVAIVAGIFVKNAEQKEEG